MTRFESRGAHRCEVLWHARDTRVYTGLGLHEDNDPTSCVRQCIIFHFVETPTTLPFIGSEGGRDYKQDLGRL
jgi:hypothetical protein